MQKRAVLFLCTGNSARSQMAEAILRHLSHGSIVVESAGSAPQPEIHPMAREAVRRLIGTEMTDQQPKSLDRFLGRRFDDVITVCDRASENCPVFPGSPRRLHWSFDDPAAKAGSGAERQKAFDDTATALMTRIQELLHTL